MPNMMHPAHLYDEVVLKQTDKNKHFKQFVLPFLDMSVNILSVCRQNRFQARKHWLKDKI